MPINLSKKDRKGIYIILVVIFIISIIFVLNAKLESSVRLDKETLCPIDSVVDSHAVVIIDKSDKWGMHDIERIETFLENTYKNLPFHGRFTLKLITGKGRSSTEVKTFFDMCNPGSEEECNAIYQNCRRIRKRYQESFSKPLQETIKNLVEPGQSSYTPLFETIIEVIDANKNPNLQIHLVSDLMENAHEFNFYEVVPLPKEIISQYPIKTDSKVTIHAHVIERYRYSKELIDAVKSVWQQYFEKQNIAIDFERLLITE